ncbi:9452_t:CDS:2, partial [Dentiscutata erythropus]
MSITSSKAEQHSRTSVPNLKIDTKRDSTIEESLKTYQLLEALRSGDTTVLSSLLSNYSLPTSSQSSITSDSNHVIPPSPLILAVQCATMTTIEFIITNFSHIIEINQRDQHGNTALHYAAKSGRIDIIDLLMKQKYINDTITNHEGKQPVEVAKNREVVNFLE